MTKIKGIYFDGNSSVGHKTELTVENNQLNFEILDSGTQFSWLSSSVEYRNLGSDTIHISHSNENENTELFEAKIYKEEEMKLAKNSLYFLQKDITSKLLFFNYKAIIPIFIVVMGFMAFAYLYAIPYAAEKVAENTSLSSEETFGELINTSMTKSLTIDTVRTERLMAFYKQLNHKTKYNIRIHFVDDDETVNAFALPGGNIYVFSGLFNKITKPEQLVSLLYHEMGHIEHRHSLKHIYRTLSRSMIISALLSDINGLSNAVIENADMIMQLKYSKELESDADTYSLKSMYDEKLDINGFISLFEILEKESEGSEVPEILSSHPLNKNRIKSAKDYILKQKETNLNPQIDSLFWRI